MSSWTEERARFVATCRRAVAGGMQTSSGGNLSLRLPDGTFLVKPSGRALADLAEADLLVLDGRGALLQGRGRPTREIPSHLAIYAAAERVGAVVHYHAPHATAFAVARRPLPLLTVHARRILGEVPLLPQAEEGSEELAAALAAAFRTPAVRAVLLAGHGLVAVGTDLAEAQAAAELVEESARIAWLAAALVR
jgi:L-ribulose-5-phosphate 4-epimerase